LIASYRAYALYNLKLSIIGRLERDCRQERLLAFKDEEEGGRAMKNERYDRMEQRLDYTC